MMCLALAWACPALADSPTQRETLRELPWVSVLLEALQPDVNRWAFSMPQLQADIELRLRRAGVPIHAEHTEPYFYVRLAVTSHSTMPGFYGYYLGVGVLQSAWLERQPAIRATLATTWEVMTMGTVGQAYLKDLRSSVLDLVDPFINAYYAVNPERTPVQPPRRRSPHRPVATGPDPCRHCRGARHPPRHRPHAALSPAATRLDPAPPAGRRTAAPVQRSVQTIDTGAVQRLDRLEDEVQGLRQLMQAVIGRLDHPPVQTPVQITALPPYPKGKAVRWNLWILDAIRDELTALAAERGVSPSQLVQEILWKVLTEHRPSTAEESL